MEPLWLINARKDVGQKEIVGRKHNPYVLRLWTLIRAPFTDDETPWCAGFVGGKLEEAGFKSTRSAWARSYMNWGVKLTSPCLGCIVVYERGPKSGHVNFFLGFDKFGNIVGIGGNQGNAVSISVTSKTRVLGYRFPLGVPVSTGRIPVLTASGALSTNEA